MSFIVIEKANYFEIRVVIVLLLLVKYLKYLNIYFACQVMYRPQVLSVKTLHGVEEMQANEL